MKVDTTYTPFSRMGSYIAFSQLEHRKPDKEPSGLWLRNVHGDANREVLHLQLLAGGSPAAADISATESVLKLQGAGGVVEIAIAAPDTVRIRGRGVGLRLTMRQGAYNCAIPEENGSWLLNAATAFRNFRAVPLRGQIAVDAPWAVAKCKHVIVDLLCGPDGAFEAAIENFVGTCGRLAHAATFDAVAADAAADFERFARPYLSVPAEFVETAREAAYLNWSTIVGACGFFTRPAMLMSKNWMCNVWSWDHAFNALALAGPHPQQAWDTLMLMFDHQAESGQLPDFVNDVVRLYNFVKPPVHGWILRRMMEMTPWIDDDRLRDIYAPLGRMTQFWLQCRCRGGSMLPEYFHGNDSGWDNATVFDMGLPAQGPDLAAFLVVQMDVLSQIAARLGREEEAARWAAQADACQQQLLAKLWNGKRFIVPSGIDGSVCEKSDSIFGSLPILLGQRLSGEVRAALTTEIGRHLTEHGLATENVNSPLYEDNGYWRGPIWAPPTMIIVDGLRQAGEDELARRIALRFCRLCARSGFAENFDARTGAPLRDRAYTWTSSVFLALATRYL